MSEHDVIVIGAGMVGAAAAYGMLQHGVRVLVLDGDDLDYRAARGNGGLVWVQGKGLEMAAYQQLTRASSDLWPLFAARLMQVGGTAIGYERMGGLDLCLGDEEMAEREALLTRLHNQPGAAERDFEMVDRAGLERLMPGVPFGPEVSGGSYCWRDGHVDPLRLLLALQRAIRTLGGTLIGQSPVRTLTREGGLFQVNTETAVHEAQRVLIAAGNGSAPLARSVGLDVPLRPQRGQMFITERMPKLLDMPAGALRQTADGTYQIGATKEEVGFDLRTTVPGIATMAQRAVRVLPLLARVKVLRHWAALRIMTPDGHPIYAESETHPGAFIAACHSGVTLAAAHSELLGAAIAAGALPADFSPFHHRRFHVQEAA